MQQKNKNAKYFACELWVKRDGTFGVVLYRDQWPVNFILHFAELHIGSSIRYENTLFKKYFFQMLYSQKKFNILQLFFLSILKRWMACSNTIDIAPDSLVR